jgi:MerR family transcriptional regulator, heat shock protein HspR
VCEELRITPARLRRYRAVGLICPLPVAPRQRPYTYDEAAVERLRTAHRLVRDLGVNVAGAEVALHLLDQVVALRRELDEVRVHLGFSQRDFATRRRWPA